MVKEVSVSVVQRVDDDIVGAWARLLPQLSGSAEPVTAEVLREVVDSPATDLLVARSNGAVVGFLTLVVFRIPTGRRAWIEDVVVDEAARGRGVGEALTRAALELAAEKGVRTVDLSSRPARAAANRLYQRLGFAPRDSTMYRFRPPDA
jgi:ribosomal protein S18 acetylase RimI-like enzyme